MKKFWLCTFLSALLGTGVAWAINYQKYGQRTGRLGPFTVDSFTIPAYAVGESDSAEPSGRAKVELVGESTHDFGSMAPGSEGEHVFIVRSVGEDDLRLRLGASTCKCTLGELEREALAPGEETEVKLTWTVKEGESDFKQSAQLITNDPARVVIQLEIIGKIISNAAAVPEEWSLGEVATGEPMEASGTIYSFLENDIKPTDMKFSSEELTSFAAFEVEPFEPTEEDGIYSKARQAFRVKIKVKGGMRQGAISQNFMFGFQAIDEQGNVIPSDSDDPNDYFVITTKGRIVGSLGMLNNSKLSGSPGGGYVYDFGRVTKDDSLVANTFVVLKGNERDNTNLSIGEIYPDDVIKATLGEPKGRGSMKLYPLKIELVPGKELIERLGNDNDDYGSVWIKSDNPKVTKMRVAIKFAIEPR